MKKKSSGWCLEKEKVRIDKYVPSMMRAGDADSDCGRFTTAELPGYTRKSNAQHCRPLPVSSHAILTTLTGLLLVRVEAIYKFRGWLANFDTKLMLLKLGNGKLRCVPPRIFQILRKPGS